MTVSKVEEFSLILNFIMARSTAFGKFCGLLLLGILLSMGVEAERTFDRCSLARKMYELGVPKNQLAQWVCIAQHESSYQTWVIGPPNDDGSRDHGIFQINDRYWCRPSDGRHSKNICNVDCAALRTDHIDQAVRCAQKVLRDCPLEWRAWSVYDRFCNGQLPSINDCFGSRSDMFGAGGIGGKF